MWHVEAKWSAGVLTWDCDDLEAVLKIIRGIHKLPRAIAKTADGEGIEWSVTPPPAPLQVAEEAE